jgi:hypothetical protein
METEKLYSQHLQKGNFVNWFVDDFYTFNFENIEFVINKHTYTYSDGTTSESLQPLIKIKGKFDGSIFLNRIGYIRIHFVDFDKKEITGYVYDEHFVYVLKPEIYDQLNSKIEQYGNSN